MSQGKDDLDNFERQWALAIKAVNRRIGDSRARRLLENKGLARVISACLEETSLPQVHTLSWLCNVLLRVSCHPRRHQLKGRHLADSGKSPTKPINALTPQEARKILEAALRGSAANESEKEECVRHAVMIDAVIDSALVALQEGRIEQLERAQELFSAIKSISESRARLNAFQGAMLAEIANIEMTKAAHQRVETVVKKYFG